MQYKQERQFGLVFAGFFTIVAFWPLWPLHEPKGWWLGATVVFLLLSIFSPRLLSPLNRIWMAIGHGLGWVNAKIILGFVFFFIVTPIGFFLKLLGRNLLGRQLSRRGSYWIKRDEAFTKQSMRNQF